MLNIRPLIEQRIRAKVPTAKEVAGACSLAELLKGRLADHGCYVIPEADRTDANKMANRVSQRDNQFFGVVYAVRNVRDARGADAADVCFALRDSALIALLGWQVHESCDPLEKTGGQLISFISGFYIWKDVYKTAQYIRSVQ